MHGKGRQNGVQIIQVLITFQLKIYVMLIKMKYTFKQQQLSKRLIMVSFLIFFLKKGYLENAP